MEYTRADFGTDWDAEDRWREYTSAHHNISFERCRKCLAIASKKASMCAFCGDKHEEACHCPTCRCYLITHDDRINRLSRKIKWTRTRGEYQGSCWNCGHNVCITSSGTETCLACGAGNRKGNVEWL